VGQRSFNVPNIVTVQIKMALFRSWFLIGLENRKDQVINTQREKSEIGERYSHS